MSDHDDSATDARPEPTRRIEGDVTRPPEKLDRGVKGGAWITRIVIAIVLVILAFVAYRVSAAFFPRWWAQQVGDQVNGRFFAGTTWGLFYGFVFTFVPLLLLFQIRRRFFSWAWRGIVAVIAIALAAPNWLTLAVVAGNSKAAHAGERILDVDAPNFRAGTLIGVVIGAALAVAITGFSMRLSHRKRQVEKLKGERDEARAAARPEPEAEES